DDQWDVPGLEAALLAEFGVKMEIAGWLEADSNLHEEPLRERILAEVVKVYQEKEEYAGGQVMRHFEKAVMLQVLDSQWKDHLAAMDHLRQGIHLRGYAQKNPKQEYKREAFELFEQMLERIKHEVVTILCRVQVRAEEDVQAIEEQRRRTAPMQFEHGQMAELQEAGEAPDEHTGATFVREERKVGRNEPCPCGSGKKYKQCHGKLA
ncbi:MAG: preprotein translocase subunit SecA, partial [Halothiobacillaceae bacterium]